MMLSRRNFIEGVVAVGCGVAVAGPASAQSDVNAHSFAFQRPEGGEMPLAAYRGRPILIVNTATRCGLAGQFATLEQLWQRYQGRGLMLIAVPSNDFGGQEPLDGLAIAQAVRQSHGVSYAFAEKSRVRGPEAHPFYRWAAAQRPQEVPSWNFHKYLVAGDGRLVGGFSSTTDPIAPRLVQAIGEQLQRG
jgi:glutathione peroxidase